MPVARPSGRQLPIRLPAGAAFQRQAHGEPVNQVGQARSPRFPQPGFGVNFVLERAGDRRFGLLPGLNVQAFRSFAIVYSFRLLPCFPFQNGQNGAIFAVWKIFAFLVGGSLCCDPLPPRI
jgi:hypothetical protein